MPDFAKKAAKKFAAVAHDGEEVHAALFVRPRNGDAAKTLGAPGGVLSRVGKLADDVAPTGDEPDPFAGNAVLLLTGQRLLAFGHGSLTGRVKAFTGEVALADIVDMHLDVPETGAATLELVLADRTVSLAPGSRRQRFVEAFADLRDAETTDA